MISQHDFNTRWWGQPVGISTEPSLLTRSPDILGQLVEPFSWVEVRCPLDQLPSGWLGPENGFQFVDVQLSYRAPLHNLAPLSRSTSIVPASESGLGDLADLAPFTAERYSKLPGITPELLALRYKKWAEDLVAEHPDWCATVLHEDRTAGYVFGSPDGTSAHFVLAASSTRATTPGLVIYLAAAQFFASKGARQMQSALSSTNVGALNAHMPLRCRFLQATGVWIRMSPPAAQGRPN